MSTLGSWMGWKKDPDPYPAGTWKDVPTTPEETSIPNQTAAQAAEAYARSRVAAESSKKNRWGQDISLGEKLGQRSLLGA